MQWTLEMTRAVWRGAMTGVTASAGLLMGWAVSAFGAGPVTPEQAHNLVEHGERGMSVLWILVAVAPIVGALVWTVVRLVRLLDKQIMESSKERAVMAAAAAKAVTDLAEAHRLERQEAAKAEREDGKQRWEAIQKVASAQTDALLKQSQSLDAVCADLERRPCIANGHLQQGATP